jgi:myosin heavy subunit
MSKNNMAQSTKIDSLVMIKGTLDKEMSGLKTELNQFKGKNEELEKAISQAHLDLSAKEIKIKRLLAENASVGRLQKEVKELRILKESHLKKIKELEEQLAFLTKQNKELADVNKELLNQVHALEEKMSVLEKKVLIGSIIKTENAIIIGEKKSKNGKFVPTKLKKAERLLVTFDLDENKVTDPGEKIFYIRVLNPSGKLIENTTSGTFTNADNNLSMPFTSMHKVSYSNAKQKVIFPVDLNSENKDHPKGTYLVEFYCNGYLSGVKKLHIK